MKVDYNTVTNVAMIIAKRFSLRLKYRRKAVKKRLMRERIEKFLSIALKRVSVRLAMVFCFLRRIVIIRIMFNEYNKVCSVLYTNPAFYIAATIYRIFDDKGCSARSR